MQLIIINEGSSMTKLPRVLRAKGKKKKSSTAWLALTCLSNLAMGNSFYRAEGISVHVYLSFLCFDNDAVYVLSISMWVSCLWVSCLWVSCLWVSCLWVSCLWMYYLWVNARRTFRHTVDINQYRCLFDRTAHESFYDIFFRKLKRIKAFPILIFI